jgi:hypothetical protein
MPFAAIMQYQPGWVGFLQTRVLTCLGCLWFNRSQARSCLGCLCYPQASGLRRLQGPGH